MDDLKPRYVYEVVVADVPDSWMWPHYPDGWLKYVEEEWLGYQGWAAEEGPPNATVLLHRSRWLTKKSAVKRLYLIRRFGATAELVRWKLTDREVIL
jgi:hypothetical protein